MARILRGEIRWADLNPVRGHEQAGERPVLVLSHDVFNERSGTVIAVALTSQEPRAGYPLTLELVAAKLPKRSWVKISQIRTLSTERIGKRLGRTSDEELAKVLEGLLEIGGCEFVVALLLVNLSLQASPATRRTIPLARACTGSEARKPPRFLARICAQIAASSFLHRTQHAIYQ